MIYTVTTSVAGFRSLRTQFVSTMPKNCVFLQKADSSARGGQGLGAVEMFRESQFDRVFYLDRAIRRLLLGRSSDFFPVLAGATEFLLKMCSSLHFV